MKKLFWLNYLYTYNLLEQKILHQTWRLLEDLCGGSFARKKDVEVIEPPDILFNKKVGFSVFLAIQDVYSQIRSTFHFYLKYV